MTADVAMDALSRTLLYRTLAAIEGGGDSGS